MTTDEFTQELNRLRKLKTILQRSKKATNIQWLTLMEEYAAIGATANAQYCRNRAAQM